LKADFNITEKLLTRFFLQHSSDTGEKWEYNETVHQLFIDFKKAYDSVGKHEYAITTVPRWD
jgi:hypothetical protein